MPTYKQRIHFIREFVIEARNAEQANIKMQKLVDEVEFASDVEADDVYEFEDEDVTCPTCKGCGYEYESDEDQCGDDCSRCAGQGTIPFSKQ